MEKKQNSVYFKRFADKCKIHDIISEGSMEIVRNQILECLAEEKMEYESSEAYLIAAEYYDWYYNGKHIPFAKKHMTYDGDLFYDARLYSEIGTEWYQKFKEKCGKLHIHGIAYLTEVFKLIMGYCEPELRKKYSSMCELVCENFDRYYIYRNHFKIGKEEFLSQEEDLYRERGITNPECRDMIHGEMVQLIGGSYVDDGRTNMYILQHFDELWGQVMPLLKDELAEYDATDSFYTDISNMCKQYNLTDVEDTMEQVLKYAADSQAEPEDLYRAVLHHFDYQIASRDIPAEEIYIPFNRKSSYEEHAVKLLKFNKTYSGIWYNSAVRKCEQFKFTEDDYHVIIDKIILAIPKSYLKLYDHDANQAALLNFNRWITDVTRWKDVNHPTEEYDKFSLRYRCVGYNPYWIEKEYQRNLDCIPSKAMAKYKNEDAAVLANFYTHEIKPVNYLTKSKDSKWYEPYMLRCEYHGIKDPEVFLRELIEYAKDSVEIIYDDAYDAALQHIDQYVMEVGI